MGKIHIVRDGATGNYVAYDNMANILGTATLRDGGWNVVVGEKKLRYADRADAVLALRVYTDLKEGALA